MLGAIDWTALGTWSLVLVGIVGVLVAQTQLVALAQNEKVKNTLELLKRYDRETVPFMVTGQEERITAATAYARSIAPENLAFLAVYSPTDHDQADYQRRWNSAVVAINYFKSAGQLWSRGLLDNDLFFGYLAPKVTGSFKLLQDLNAMRGQTTPKYGLGDFAEAAQRFQDAQEKTLGISPTAEAPRDNA